MKPFDTKQGKPVTAQHQTIQAPSGGLNTFSATGGGNPMDALYLRNFVAQPFGCLTRRGYRKNATGLDGWVQSLIPWHGPSSSKLFAITSNGSMYDVTTPGPVGAPLLTGLTNGWWQHVEISNSGGHFTLACNGADNWVKYDGTSVTRITSVELTGVDPKSIISLEIHQRRLWMIQKDSMAAWYLAPDAIQGAATKFDLGPMFNLGGYLKQAITWTLDSGSGADDHLAFLTSEGQAAVYSGTDPANASTWSNTGVYYVGTPPAGNRIAMKYAGDVIVITQYGVIPLSQGLVSTKVNPTENGITSTNIQSIISNNVRRYGDSRGWGILLYPDYNLVMINVPADGCDASAPPPTVPPGTLIPATRPTQEVLQTITNGWSEFDGYNAACLTLFDSDAYFGGDGYVGKMLQGWRDGADYNGDGGMLFTCEAQSAFNYLGAPGRTKQAKMYRVNVVGDIAPYITSEVRREFDTSPLTPSYLSAAPLSVGYWGTAKWGQNVWGGVAQTFRPWQSTGVIGMALSLRLVLTPFSDTLWVSTDWIYEVGGVW